LTAKAPIHVVLRRIRPLAPVHKVAHLRGLIASEPKRSIRRVELEAALKDIFTEEMAKECPRKRGQRRVRIIAA
jgi:hypothetical protein